MLFIDGICQSLPNVNQLIYGNMQIINTQLKPHITRFVTPNFIQPRLIWWDEI